jgi:phosphate transport system permease protein
MDTVKMLHSRALDLSEKIEGLENRLTELTEPLVRLQREISLLEISPDSKAEQGKARLEKMYDESDKLEAETGPEYQKLTGELEKLKSTNAGLLLNMSTAEGRDVDIPFSKIVRIYQPNRMGVIDKSLLYASKLAEFVAADPRESNTEGGVFPAIFGTVMMVLLMSVAVVPFGVLAAVYLNEYARQGTVTRLIRLSVNNLAGVPSIVFGIFGLGFFIYMVGGSIDQLFFSERLPEPTFGTGGILWASLTLALLTLPVVVVATEEGILAVPRANKEGALALGATKWQMIRKIVLPNAMPGILTGIILAISRGAGEVAPLMITGVVKLAPTLPFDLTFPFLHLDRKFMHLGFHIYDVGFQSPNVEAAKPMVYSTALLLILIVILLNILAIYIRNRLRKKYKSAAF